METRLNEVKALTEKLAKRVNSAVMAGNLELIEADIIQDILKQVYILVDDLKSESHQSTIPAVQHAPGSELKQDIESPGQTGIPNQSETLSFYHEPQVPVNSEPQVLHIEQPVTPATEPVETNEINVPVQPAAHFIEEVPVMTFPKVEVSLNPEKIIEPAYKEPERIQPQQTQYEPVKVQPAQPQYQQEKIGQPQATITQRQPERPAKPSSGRTSASNDLFGGQTIADKLKNETPSLNDRITQGKTDHSLAHKMQLKPITDLKTAIGINEKFQFVNDLFEGRIELYNDAISRLNNCTSGSSAEVLLEDLKTAHNWKAETEAYNKLRTFINRRYI